MGAVAGRWAPHEMAEQALAAGCDVLLACRSFARITALLEHLERMPDTRLAPALTRVAALKRRFATARPVQATTSAQPAGPPYPEHQALAARLTRDA
jgi:beta-glucosidase-like glycosyl hydrolase